MLITFQSTPAERSFHRIKTLMSLTTEGTVASQLCWRFKIRLALFGLTSFEDNACDWCVLAFLSVWHTTGTLRPSSIHAAAHFTKLGTHSHIFFWVSELIWLIGIFSVATRSAINLKGLVPLFGPTGTVFKLPQPALSIILVVQSALSSSSDNDVDRSSSAGVVGNFVRRVMYIIPSLLAPSSIAMRGGGGSFGIDVVITEHHPFLPFRYRSSPDWLQVWASTQRPVNTDGQTISWISRCGRGRLIEQKIKYRWAALCNIKINNELVFATFSWRQGRVSQIKWNTFAPFIGRYE